MKIWSLRTGAFLLVAFAGNFGYSNYEENRLISLAQSVVNDIGDQAISARFIENSLVLEGAVTGQAKKDRAEIIAKTYLKGFHLRNLFQQPEVVNLIDLKNPERKSASMNQ